MDNETDLPQRIASLETSVTSLTDATANLPRGITQDDLNNAVSPYADELANLSASIASLNEKIDALPEPTVSELGENEDVLKRWLDKVLYTYFFNDKPAS